MRRRNNRAASLIEGFTAGMRMGQMAREGMKQSELRDAAQTTPLGQMQDGSQADVQAQLDAGAGMGEARILSSPGRAAPSADEVSSARRTAQIGVLEKYGDIEGANRIRAQDQQLKLGEQQMAESRARTERENKVFTRQEKAWADEDAYKADRNAAFDASSFGAKAKAYNEAMADYSSKKAEYDKKVEAGDTAAVAPVAPSKPTFSMGEALLDRANSLAVEIKHGRATGDDMLKFASLQKQVQDEGYVQSLRLAQSGAPLTAVIDHFNKNGQVKIDPSSITEDKTLTRDGGVKSRLITFRRPDGVLQTIDTLADLDSLGKAGEVFDRAYKDHSMRVQDKQLQVAQGHLGVAQAAGARANAEFAAGAPERQLRGTVASLQLAMANTDDPAQQKAIQSKLDAVRGGVGDKDQPAEVKLAGAMVRAGLAPDMQSALRMAISKKGESPEEIHKEFVASIMKGGLVKPADAVAQADEVMTSMGYAKKGNRWSGGDAAPATGGGMPAKEADALAEARNAVARGADKAAVNERLKKAGFKPLP